MLVVCRESGWGGYILWREIREGGVVWFVVEYEDVVLVVDMKVFFVVLCWVGYCDEGDVCCCECFGCFVVVRGLLVGWFWFCFLMGVVLYVILDLYLCFDVYIFSGYFGSVEEDMIIVIIVVIDLYGVFFVVCVGGVKSDFVFLVVVWCVCWLCWLVLFVFEFFWDLG